VKPRDIIILGVNGNCVDIAEAIDLLAERGTPVKVAGFLDDNVAVQGKLVAGFRVLGRIADAPKFADARFVCGIGSPQSYRRKLNIIASTGLPVERWMTVVHPAASVSRTARLGCGTVVLANSSIGVNARVGNHVMILQNSVISHDAVVGDGSVLATGVCVSGMVVLGESTYVGSNAAIRERLQVGDRALVGIGAVVTRDIEVDAVVAGNPARPIRRG